MRILSQDDQCNSELIRGRALVQQVFVLPTPWAHPNPQVFRNFHNTSFPSGIRAFGLSHVVSAMQWKLQAKNKKAQHVHVCTLFTHILECYHV